MCRVKIALETHALIVSRAIGGFDCSRTVFCPGGVEIELSDATLTALGAVHPDPDLAIRKVLLGENVAVH